MISTTSQMGKLRLRCGETETCMRRQSQTKTQASGTKASTVHHFVTNTHMCVYINDSDVCLGERAKEWGQQCDKYGANRPLKDGRGFPDRITVAVGKVQGRGGKGRSRQREEV